MSPFAKVKCKPESYKPCWNLSDELLMSKPSKMIIILKTAWGRRDGSAEKSTYCSYKETKLDS